MDVIAIIGMCIAGAGIVFVFALLLGGDFFMHRHATKKANQEMRKWVEEQRGKGMVPDGYEWEDVEP